MSDNLFGVLVAIVLTAVIIVGGVLIYHHNHDQTTRRDKKLEMCRTIEDGAVKTLCIQSVGD